MITKEEILKGQITDSETLKSIEELVRRLNIIRKAYGKPMVVTSGLRSVQHHIKIYDKKGIPPNNVPLKSRHLFGQAADISDPKQELQKWIMANIQILEEAELWCEDFKHTPAWVHFQSEPPKSGKRFFIP